MFLSEFEKYERIREALKELTAKHAANPARYFQAKRVERRVLSQNPPFYSINEGILSRDLKKLVRCGLAKMVEMERADGKFYTGFRSTEVD